MYNLVKSWDEIPYSCTGSFKSQEKNIYSDTQVHVAKIEKRKWKRVNEDEWNVNFSENFSRPSTMVQ